MRVVGLIVGVLAVTLTVVAVTSRGRGHTQESPAQTQVAAGRAQTVILNVPEMFCAGCEVGVKIAANKVDGVTEVKTDSGTRTVAVTFDPSKSTAQAIASAITKGTGFKTELAISGSTGS